MNKVHRKFALILGFAILAAGLMAVQPAFAGQKNIVKGEIVSFDADANKLVVKAEGGMEEVTFSTSVRTSVVGLRGGSAQDDVSVLIGMQGSQVTVKFRNGGNGKEASLVRIKPVKS